MPQGYHRNVGAPGDLARKSGGSTGRFVPPQTTAWLRVAISSENCGRVHDKTIAANGVVCIVRGSRVAAYGGCAAGKRAGAVAAGASKDGARYKYFGGRQRGDVHDDVRAAGRGV